MPARKYRNEPVKVDGIRFASKREAHRYAELQLLVRGRRISDLTLQPRFPLDVNGHHVCTYVGDFRYQECGKVVCEDAKGMRTRDYAIKRKLFMALYPNIEHREV